MSGGAGIFSPRLRNGWWRCNRGRTDRFCGQERFCGHWPGATRRKPRHGTPQDEER
ncbi:MAG: hypothetical protein OXU61_07240 [Gammaproteobacteria bacterium]|nr:hypothetical protein [Gammaproteobacteria bacterium]